MSPEGFLADVLAAPERLARTLDAYEGAGSPLRGLGARPPERVLLLGMGSSHFAAQTAATHLRARGLDAVAELSSTGLPAPPRAGTLVVGISASGATPETVEALARHRGTAATVAVTNAAGSELAEAADVLLPLHCGAEAGGVACITFQATLAVLLLLCGAVTGGPTNADLRPAVAAAASLRETRGGWLPRLVELLRGAHTVYAIAPAERLSSALQGALMLREGPRLPADAAETGDWLHVDVYLSKRPGYRALLFTGSRFDAGVLDWTRRRAATVVTVGAALDGTADTVAYPGSNDLLVATLVETAVVELVAAELWLEQGPAPVSDPAGPASRA